MVSGSGATVGDSEGWDRGDIGDMGHRVIGNMAMGDIWAVLEFAK